MKGSQSRADAHAGDGKDAKGNPSAQGGVMQSGLLNGLDSFYAPTGVLFVMTTNHIEKLDAVLLRPARIGCRLYLGKASDHQEGRTASRFFLEASEVEAWEFFEASDSTETMAEFRGCSWLKTSAMPAEARVNCVQNR